MMKEVEEPHSLVKTALRLFVGDVISDVSKFDDVLVFRTENGLSGMVEKNQIGEWEIWIGEDVIYSIEEDIFSIMDHDGGDESLFKLYKDIKVIDRYELKDKSKLFLDIVKQAVENLLLNSRLPLVGSTNIGSTQVIYKKEVKIRINLN
jgi:hypothetical protein